MITINESFICNSEKFISSSIGDEIILMNIDTGDYVALNVVSADIWKLAEKQTTSQKVIDSLFQQYDVEEQVCKKQTLSCIENMLEKGLLVKL